MTNYALDETFGAVLTSTDIYGRISQALLIGAIPDYLVGRWIRKSLEKITCVVDALDGRLQHLRFIHELW